MQPESRIIFHVTFLGVFFTFKLLCSHLAFVVHLPTVYLLSCFVLLQRPGRVRGRSLDSVIRKRFTPGSISITFYYPMCDLGPIYTMRHFSVSSPFHLRSFRMACVHTVHLVHSSSRTAHDRRPAIISIQYAAHCYGMHFPLFVNYQNFGDDRMIVTSKCAIKNVETHLIFSTLHLFVPTVCLSKHCHYTSYLTYHIIPHISALILLIFHPFLKNKTGSTRCKQTLEVQWRRRKTVHIMGIEQVQAGPDPVRHVKHSRSATATERNSDVTETFLPV